MRGLGWVYLNQTAQHIRVVNLSVGTTVPGSYAYSPTDAAVERLWSSGVTVVVAAGNLGSDPDAVSYAPANDPYVITVGCLDDNQTASTTADDSLCPISSRGMTQDGFAKPDVIAPGRKVTSALAAGNPVLAQEFPDRITSDGQHLRMSGTSMAAPIVSGTVALLLERFPNLTPDQIKNILSSTALPYPGEPDHAGVVNAAAALHKAPSVTVCTERGRGRVARAQYRHRLRLGPVGRLALGNRNVGRPGTARAGAAFLPGTVRAGKAFWDGSRWEGSRWDGSRWTARRGTARVGKATPWDGSRWTSTSWYGTSTDSAYWDAAALYY